jgi:pimeloyl-ACP methyl ester carboxylesterase
VTSSETEPTHHFIEGSPRLHAVEWRSNSAPTLFLLHGATQHSRYWDPLVCRLDPYRVVALDARGHGASEWGEPGDYDPDHYLADLERAIEQLAPDQPVALIGHSTGSLVSMQYAARHPGRLWAIVFVDIDPRPPDRQRERLQGAGSRPARTFESLADARGRIELLTPGLSDADYDLLAATTFERSEDGSYRQRLDQRTLAEYPRFDNRSLLPGIELPALVMRGADSTVNGADAAAAAAKSLPQGELATVRGEHQLHVQQPEAVAQVLLEFLGRCAPGA